MDLGNAKSRRVSHASIRAGLLACAVWFLSEGPAPPRAADGHDPDRKSVAKPVGAGTSVEALCSGDAGGLLYPLDATTIGDWTLAFPGCDDCSGPSTPLGFTFHLYGDLYTEAFVNNNGNVSFGGPYDAFEPQDFPDTRYRIVGPFYADADNRDNPDQALPADVYQRFVDGDGDGSPDTFVVTWRNVGYFERSFDRRNTFQVAISDGTNEAMGLGNNVCFSYDVMCWTTGRFDGGVGGFGPTPARVGVNRGDGVDFAQIGRFNHDGSDYHGPFGEPGGVHYLDHQRFCFSTATSNGNLCPIAADFPPGGRLVLAPTESLSRVLRFLSPEAPQTTTVTLDDPGGAQSKGLAVTNQSGNVATLGLDWAPTCASLGSYPLVFHATDDVTEPCTTAQRLEIVVTCDDQNPCTQDSCDPATGCVHSTGGCDDGNPCTDDACDSGGGCVHTPNTAPCDDGNPCTADDRCDGGRCAGGPAVSCDDQNACTDDACDPARGCVHRNNEASCDDGNPCTVQDRCRRRSCTGGRPAGWRDGAPCTRDSCDPASGCVHVAGSDEDGDGVCDRIDQCPHSIRTPTVVVGTCDSGVPNVTLRSGCTIADLLAACGGSRLSPHSDSRSDRGASCVANTLDRLRRLHAIDQRQKRAIERCYGGER